MLFQEVTAMADADGKKCYLESSRDEPNTKIYEKLGFRKVKEMECNDDGEMIKVSPSSGGEERRKNGILIGCAAVLYGQGSTWYCKVKHVRVDSLLKNYGSKT